MFQCHQLCLHIANTSVKRHLCAIKIITGTFVSDCMRSNLRRSKKKFPGGGGGGGWVGMPPDPPSLHARKLIHMCCMLAHTHTHCGSAPQTSFHSSNKQSSMKSINIYIIYCTYLQASCRIDEPSLYRYQGSNFG